MRSRQEGHWNGAPDLDRGGEVLSRWTRVEVARSSRHGPGWRRRDPGVTAAPQLGMLTDFEFLLRAFTWRGLAEYGENSCSARGMATAAAGMHRGERLLHLLHNSTIPFIWFDAILSLFS